MRAPPNVERAAPADGGNGSLETDRLASAISEVDKANPAASQLLTEFNDHLETCDRMAAWREDLGARLWRATIRAELVGLDPDEQDRLEQEVHDFHRICFHLAARMKGACDERVRRAA